MRTLRKYEAKKYIKEFPFLPQLVPIKELAAGNMIGEIRIQVQVADRESLYLAPDFCLPPHWEGNGDGTLVGRKYPHVYAILDDGSSYRRSWDYDHQGFFSGYPLFNGAGIEAMVMVTVYEWYKYEDWLVKGANSALSHYEYVVSIFKKPEGGFEKLIKEADLLKNVKITNLEEFKSVEIAGNYEAASLFRELKLLKGRIEETFGPNLWTITHEFKMGGMSGQFGGTELRTFTIGGNTVISFVKGEDQITFKGDEKDISTMGCASISCTFDGARSMIEDVVSNWKDDDNQLHPQEDVLPIF